MRSLAAGSPRSMRFASATSSAAVSSLWRPAASMKSCSGSSVPDGAGPCSATAALGAHDHVALLEGVAQRGQLVVGELVLVGQRLELLLLDEAALGGLLEQALGRGQVVQVNGLAQLNPFLLGGRADREPRPRRPRRAVNRTRDVPVGLSE